MNSLITKVAELSSDEEAKQNTVDSSSSVCLHVCEDNLIVGPVVINDDLEQYLCLNLKNDPLQELYAESEASTSLDHLEQACVSRQSYFEALALKGKTVPYGSEFRITTKDRCAGTSFNASQYLVVDAATQTGKDDELPIQHTKSFNLSDNILPCPMLQAANSPVSTSREEMLFKHKVITQNLTRKESSPPPCSTSPSTITSAHCAASGNTVVSDCHPKLIFNPSVEDQMFPEKNSYLSPRGHQSKDNAHSEKPESAMIGLAHGICNDHNPLCCRLITSSTLADSDKKFCTVAVDYSCQESKRTLDTTNVIKPHHEISIFSSSGRFLRLVLCGGGLEVIRPTRRSANQSDREHVDDCEESSAGAAKDAKDDSPCMHTSLSNVKNNALANIGSPLPYVANDVLFGGYLSLVNGDNETVFTAQEAKTGNKKLWHMKDWVNSHYKRIKSTRGGIEGSSTTFATNSFACLDLREKHEPA